MGALYVSFPRIALPFHDSELAAAHGAEAATERELDSASAEKSRPSAGSATNVRLLDIAVSASPESTGCRTVAASALLNRKASKRVWLR